MWIDLYFVAEKSVEGRGGSKSLYPYGDNGTGGGLCSKKSPLKYKTRRRLILGRLFDINSEWRSKYEFYFFSKTKDFRGYSLR